ncbi:MAG: ankyrin repeat domain-containing protein [Rickettsiales bacterium]|nr:ankyrin repeat domain-containing protein [Rickettsiales bacterium]
MTYDLFSASKNDNVEEVRRLVELGANINELGAELYSLLHYTAECGYIKTTKYLVEEQNMNINKINKYSHTPLYCATESGQTETVAFLASKNALFEKEMLDNFCKKKNQQIQRTESQEEKLKLKSEIELIKNLFKQKTIENLFNIKYNLDSAFDLQKQQVKK